MCKYLQADRTAKGITETHLLSGRGMGKTIAGCIKAGEIGWSTMPGYPLFWTEPRHRDFHRIFLPTWEKLYPRSMWEFNESKSQLTLSSGTKIDLISRNVDNRNKRVGHGPNYAGGWHDELADKYDARTYADFKNSVRIPDAPFLFIDTLSTPDKANSDYQQLVTTEGATLITGSSYDNPFLDKEAIQSMEASMSPEYARAQIYGQFIAFEGRVWANFSEADWPAGNMHPSAVWEPSRPWFLGVDLGQGYGHWQIWQYHNPVDSRHVKQFDGMVAVVVAEGVQHQESFFAVLNRIREKFAKTDDHPERFNPVLVAVGHDVQTRGSTGPAPSNFLTQLHWDYWYPRKHLAEKSTQHQVLSKLILNTLGERRFCISKDIIRDGPSRDNWGVLHCMRNDTYPEPGAGEWFIKDKKSAGQSAVEDARDSTLYLATCQHPPEWAEHDRWAQ
jgi:hypothetical protein